jgi:hypothetical protein
MPNGGQNPSETCHEQVANCIYKVSYQAIATTSNLEKCVENATHCHADQLQPIPAKVAAETYPE